VKRSLAERAGRWIPAPEMWSPMVRALSSVPPMLSIVIPAHDEEAELPHTLEALRRALHEAGIPATGHEIIVVDDSSTDGTARVAIEGGATVVPALVRQIAAARNVGAGVANGDLLLFVDADTRVTAATVRGAVAALAQGAVGGGAEVRWEPPVPWWGTLYLWIFMQVWRRLGHAAGCFLFCRRADFEAVGGFDERYYASEEIWLSKALRERGQFVILPDPVLTSGRKIRLNSALGMLFTAIRLLVRGPRGWQGREGLGLWYEGGREARPPAPLRTGRRPPTMPP